MNAEINQLKYLTLGKIAEMTEQSIDLLNSMKHFKLETKKTQKQIEKISAQEIIDSTDTKIKVNLR